MINNEPTYTLARSSAGHEAIWAGDLELNNAAVVAHLNGQVAAIAEAMRELREAREALQIANAQAAALRRGLNEAVMLLDGYEVPTPDSTKQALIVHGSAKVAGQDFLDELMASRGHIGALVKAVQFEQAALDTYEATRGTEDWPNAGNDLELAGIATARCLAAARAWLRRA